VTPPVAPRLSRPVKSPIEPALATPSMRPGFTALYDEHVDFVWRTLRRLGVPDAQLDDATQDVFLVVYRRLPEFEGRSSARTWLCGIALRVASAHRRAAARRPTVPLAEDVTDERARAAEDLTDATQAAAVVRAVLEELDEDRRAVFVLAELEEMTAPEIAAVLGVNLNTVYSRLRLARRDFEVALARHRSRRPA
jgi:RNA polymerase sigma-70 factor, ECF subfamily